MKRITAFLLALFLLVGLSVSAFADETVYITKTGEKYHRDGCRFLSESQIAISLSDALSAGYTPCKVCKPPAAYISSSDEVSLSEAAVGAAGIAAAGTTVVSSGSSQVRTSVIESVPEKHEEAAAAPVEKSIAIVETVPEVNTVPVVVESVRTEETTRAAEPVEEAGFSKQMVPVNQVTVVVVPQEKEKVSFLQILKYTIGCAAVGGTAVYALTHRPKKKKKPAPKPASRTYYDDY